MTFSSTLLKFARRSPNSERPANPASTVPMTSSGVRAASDAPPSASDATSHADNVLNMAAELINEQTAKLVAVRAVLDTVPELQRDSHVACIDALYELRLIVGYK